ncbi:4-hydroxyphenylpyruvate dioxygenase [Rubrivirga litoralis]|uniref:4-hydroxyphenylpyruvate dioxygenase n=1 Tax=Rubrivirga litoralis TaxID=3075598 RepID=A0ABU3BMR3_9BACT|nr:4-hydroxyphenylpyruvate dioxygenase [Rubrivirga sp. F394]MDT0630587.1 4-hydroxyphenylpyruvate dioxygenase [Rubrivirga sp. F394]
MSTQPNPADLTSDPATESGDGSALGAVATEPAAQQTNADTAEKAGLSLKGAPDHVEDDFLPINGTDHIEFYVGNAKQAARYYASCFGFEIKAYRGPETGHRDSASYLLVQDKVRFVLTTAIRSDHPIAQHVAKHGDGVKDIALWVDDARKSFEEVTKRGATAVREPQVLSDDDGEVVVSAMGTYGDTIHTFVERKDYDGLFMPGFEAYDNPYWKPEGVGLKYVDHCVGNVHLGDMNKYVQYYSDTMGFRNLLTFTDSDIQTEYSSLMSKVMSNGNERIKFPINEPAQGKKRSQIDEYLDFYDGAGVQHIALATDDILDTVSKLRARGVEFLTVPTNYYEQLQGRVGQIDEPVDQLAELGILVDRDPDGYLLQIFTKPVEDRPTVFYEIIQRKGARTFGEGNFKALFEAIEREQERRGNL